MIANQSLAEYKIVKIELGGIFNPVPKEDYTKVIAEYSSKGWHLVQIFAPGMSNNGLPKFFDVIFEKTQQLYEYKIIKIELGGIFNPVPKEDYTKVIAEYSAKGWNLVQIFAPGMANNGLPKFFDVIFERPIQNANS